MSLKLTSENVEEVLLDCLFHEDEDKSNRIEVEGILNSFGFHPQRLEQHKQDIASMLKQLPTEFHEKGGGGWSFLNAYMTNTGEQWGEHADIEKLLCLGIATKQAKILLSREMWTAFPGGMPYFIVCVE